jgi:hypothetical protein
MPAEKKRIPAKAIFPLILDVISSSRSNNFTTGKTLAHRAQGIIANIMILFLFIFFSFLSLFSSTCLTQGSPINHIKKRDFATPFPRY